MITSLKQMELYKYLESIRQEPYVLGKHDCLTFTNKAWEILYDRGWAADVLGKYLTKSGKLKTVKTLQKELNIVTYCDLVDARLNRHEYMPDFGMLVGVEPDDTAVFNVALGICVGTTVAVVGNEGLIYVPVQDAKICWVN